MIFGISNNFTPIAEDSKDDFLLAIYKTLISYKGQVFADDWKKT